MWSYRLLLRESVYKLCGYVADLDISHSRAKLRAITLKSSYVLPLLSDPQFSFFFLFFLWIVLKV